MGPQARLARRPLHSDSREIRIRPRRPRASRRDLPTHLTLITPLKSRRPDTPVQATATRATADLSLRAPGMETPGIRTAPRVRPVKRAQAIRALLVRAATDQARAARAPPTGTAQEARVAPEGSALAGPLGLPDQADTARAAQVDTARAVPADPAGTVPATATTAREAPSTAAAHQAGIQAPLSLPG
jgi:hypothetical protein